MRGHVCALSAQAYLQVAPFIAGFAEYCEALIDHLIQRCFSRVTCSAQQELQSAAALLGH